MMATRKKAKNSQKPSAEPQLAAANAERVAKIEVPPLPKPDWALWGQMRRANLVQAVLLSLDIAPADPRHLSGSGTWYYFYPNEVARRLAVAANHLGRDGPLHPLDWDGLVTSPPRIQPELFAAVDLREFFEFALARGWEIPDKFPRPQTVDGKPDQTKRKKGQKWTEEEREELRRRVDESSLQETAAYYDLSEQAVRNQHHLGKPKQRY
jgi:hypothetical protein